MTDWSLSERFITMKKLYILVAIFSFLFPLAAQASVAGKVVYHSGEAWALRDGERVALQKGVEVHSGDVIVTTMSGRTKLSMIDNSVVYVGRQSRITIDRYDMKEGSLFSGSFDMLWGKVRFLVTKLNSSRANFSVRTKTATIGVRGTQFAILVDPPSVIPKLSIKVPDSIASNVPTTVMLFEGAVIGKSIKGQIVNIKPGTIVRLKPNGAILSRKIQAHDLKVLDIESLALRKRPTRLELTKQPITRTEPTKLEPLSSPTKLEPLSSPTRLEPLSSPTKLEPLSSPTKLQPTTTLIAPKLEPLNTPTKLAPPPPTKVYVAPPPPTKVYVPLTTLIKP